MKITFLAKASFMATLSVCLLSANSLRESFAKGKINGELRAFYFNQNKKRANADMATNGLNLYTSALEARALQDRSKQYAADINDGFSDIELTLGARHTYIQGKSETSAAKYEGQFDNVNLSDIYALYKFKRALKGLSPQTAYEAENHRIKAKDMSWFTFRVKYKF